MQLDLKLEGSKGTKWSGSQVDGSFSFSLIRVESSSRLGSYNPSLTLTTRSIAVPTSELVILIRKLVYILTNRSHPANMAVSISRTHSYPKEKINVLLLENLHENGIAMFNDEGFHV